MTNPPENPETQPPALDSKNLATTTLPLPRNDEAKTFAKEQRLAIIGGVSIVALILFSWLTWPNQAPSVAVVAPASAPLPSSPLFAQTPPTSENAKDVSLQLNSTPPGARVVCFVAGEPVEVEPTPSALSVAKGAQVELTFVAPGYESKQKVLSADKDQDVAVTLSERGKAASGGHSSGGGWGPGH